MSTWREKYMRDPELADSIITTLRSDLDKAEARIKKLEHALERIRDCDISQKGSAQDRIDTVREALQ